MTVKTCRDAFVRLPLLLTLLTLMTAGCQSPGEELLPGLGNLLEAESTSEREEEHRRKFQETRDPDELKWLLRHAIESGMTVTEVARVLGEDGRQVYEDGWIKQGEGHYQSGDETWKWGPDREGNSVFLVFRDGKLVNFDPREFEPGPTWASPN